MTLRSMMIAAAGVAAIAGSAGPTLAQGRDVREAREDLRDERRDLREAERFGNRGDVREEARDVRRAERDLSREIREDRTADRRYRGGAYVPPPRYAYRRWSVGERLPSSYLGDRYFLSASRYALPPVPRGYRWVRVGRDALLVDWSGWVQGIRRSVFY